MLVPGTGTVESGVHVTKGNTLPSRQILMKAESIAATAGDREVKVSQFTEVAPTLSDRSPRYLNGAKLR